MKFILCLLVCVVVAKAQDATTLHKINTELGVVTAWKGHELFAVWLAEHLSATTSGSQIEIVDLGVDTGFSTFVWALATADGKGHVTGVDTFMGDGHTGPRDTYKSVVQIKERLGLKYKIDVDLVKDDFTAVAQRWTSLVDIIHLDGFHTYDASKHDYNTWTPKLKDGGVFLMHDTISFPGVRKTFDESPLHKVTFVHSHGLGVLSHNKELIDTIAKKFGLPILTRTDL